MKTLLRIDASPRTSGSHSRDLADALEARWIAAHGGRVVRRDLAARPVPHLDADTLRVFMGGPGEAALSDELVAELRAADHLLLASPLYNFGLSSAMKAYLDHVVRRGQTFARDERGPVGLLTDKQAFVVTVRGDLASEPDFQTPLLYRILAFLGIARVELVALDGTAQPPAVRAERLAAAHARLEEIFAPR